MRRALSRVGSLWLVSGAPPATRGAEIMQLLDHGKRPRLDLVSELARHDHKGLRFLAQFFNISIKYCRPAEGVYAHALHAE